MRIFLTIITLFSAITGFKAQVIKGIVTCANFYHEPIENAFVMLKLSSGNTYMVKTDKQGKYEFELKKDSTSRFEITVGTDKMTTSKTGSKCGFLATRDKGEGTLSPGSTYIKDFQIHQITECGRPPLLLFYKNSILSCNDSISKTDSLLVYQKTEDTYNSLCITLQDNPTITIQIQGHTSSHEINPDLLSLYRAQLVKEVLVAKGINPKRLEVKGWGKQKLMIKDEIIAKAKTQKEKAVMHQKNQRVYFIITGWDFKE